MVLIINCTLYCYTAALAALKRKKRFEKQLQQIDGTLTTIEFQREALENASTNTEVLKVMGVAAKALKGAHNNLYVSNRLLILIQICYPKEMIVYIGLVCLFCLVYNYVTML